MKVMFAHRWVESTRGWGVRPDGYSLHASREDAEAFVRNYWAGMPASTPDEYSRPSGDPMGVIIEDKDLIKEIESSRNGVRKYNWSPNK